MLLEDCFDQQLEPPILDVSIDQGVQLLLQLVGREDAVGNQVEEVVSILGVLIGGAASAQDLDLHAIAHMKLAAHLQTVSLSLRPRERIREEPMILPKWRFDRHALVSKKTLNKRLICLGCSPCFLDKSREADRFLT